MPAFVTFGRILFAVLFIVSGAGKLFDLPAATDLIAAKVAIPAIVTPYATQARRIDRPEDAAHARNRWGAIELVCGICIALNFGDAFLCDGAGDIRRGRDASISTISGIRPATPRSNNMVQALKNLSIVGALFLLIGIGGRRRPSTSGYAEI